MARLGGFPENRPLNIDALFGPMLSSSGSGVQTSLPPGPERKAILDQVLGALSEQVSHVSDMIAELRGLMVGRDITQLISAVVVPAMTVGSTSRQGVADGNTTSTWAAKIEYLVGVALSLNPTGDAGTPIEIVRRATQLISDIFDTEQMRLVAQSIENADSSDVERELLLQQIQLEYQTDRMPGYAAHLERVDSEVFGRHRDYYRNALGFDPADVIRCTRLHTQSIREGFSAAMTGAAEALNTGGINPDGEREMRNAFDAITLWRPADVARSTGIAVEQITAMLDYFSAEYGCQPDFRRPGDPNRARTHPCIKLGNLTYLVPDPRSLSAVIHQRLVAEPQRDNYDPKKYFKHRQDAHERLVHRALGTVFGQANVYSTQHYDLRSGQHGEIDSLVCTEWPLVVEAKAIALTEPGRRGAPSRVDAKIKAILRKSLDQTDRALSYILDQGGHTFAPTESGRAVELLPDSVAGGTAIIVTFERIDPFASGGLGVAGNVNWPTWVVSLTDLLMTTDILSDPSAFHHYARTRAGMHSARAHTLTEADALGAYLLSRLSILDSAEEDTRIVIGHSCEALNEFYTRQEAGWAAEKPSTGVSREVASALAAASRKPGWVTAVDAVMTSEPSAWRKWKNFRRRHRRGGTFLLNARVSLVASTATESSLERTGQSLLINIPRLS